MFATLLPWGAPALIRKAPLRQSQKIRANFPSSQIATPWASQPYSWNGRVKSQILYLAVRLAFKAKHPDVIRIGCGQFTQGVTVIWHLTRSNPPLDLG